MVSVKVIEIVEFVEISAYHFDSVISPASNRVDSFCAVDSLRIAFDRSASHLKVCYTDRFL